MIDVADVDELLRILECGAEDDDGEGVDLLAHSLQCAAILERTRPDDLELQVAGLVHDLGTILEPGHPRSHARTGGEAVRSMLGPRVADLVTSHDEAKRYLVTVEPSYRSRLSPQSIATLSVQGGVMTDAERVAFDQRTDADACLTLRRADDDAKVPGSAVPPLEHWRPALLACAQRSSGASPDR